VKSKVHVGHKKLRKFKLHLIEDELVNKYICITFGLRFVQGLTKKKILHCRFILTTRNQEIFKLIHKKEKILKQIIRIQQDQATIDRSFCANDILDFMMSTIFNNDNRKVVHGTRSQLNIQNLIDECKTLFLTSYSIMASLLTWTMLFLA
jgi:hypothetical protein